MIIAGAGAPSGNYGYDVNEMVYLRDGATGTNALVYKTVDNGTTWRLDNQDLILPAATELTIATGAITATQSLHNIDTEGDAASDDLDTINGLAAGEVCFFYPNNAARTVVFKHGTGNILCPNARDISLAEVTDYVMCIGNGTNVIVVAESTLSRDTLPELIFDAASELTIATGAITVTQFAHTVDTEGDAASDDLDTINGGTAEEVIWLRPNNAARTVVVKHGTGNILCPNGRDISLAEVTDYVQLYYDGSNWAVIASNTLAADTHPDLIFDAATELTISTGAITVTQAAHTVDTEGDAGSDDLDTVSGGTAEEVIWLRAENAGRDVVVKHGTGNILCPEAQDITLAEVSDFVQLYYDGSNWTVVAWRTAAQRPTTKFLTYAGSSLTIATGAITVTGGSHAVDTEAAAASDDLDTINGGTADELVLLRLADATHNVVVKHGTGNITCPDGDDIILDTLTDFVLVAYEGTGWRVIASSLDVSTPHSDLRFQAATELTIATGEITVTQARHTIDTEADAGTDDLDTINGLGADELVWLTAENAGRDVVVKHGTGNILCPNGRDITLAEVTDGVMVLGDGSNAIVLAAGTLAADTHPDLVFDAATELTISTGAITATQGIHSVDTEGDAASDDLDTINGVVAGELVIFYPENAARTVVVKHGTGNIYCPNSRDISLAEVTDYVIGVGDGTNVIIVAASTLARDTLPELIFDAATELTISTGAITATQAAHKVDTEGDAASDDLDTINGGTAEEVIWLRAENSGRTVVVKHGTGNIVCPNGRDISLAEVTDYVQVVYDGSNWVVVSWSTTVDDLEDVRIDTFTNPAAAGTNILVQKAADFDETTWGNLTQPDVPRVAQVAASAGPDWDGGDIEVTGLTMAGDDATDTITPVAGSTVQGTIPFQLIRRVRNLGTHSAGTMDVQCGIAMGVVVGSKSPTLLEAYETSAGGRDAGATLSADGAFTPTAAPDGAKDYVVSYKT